MKEINSIELKVLMKNTPDLVVVDVRTEGEVAAGMIDGAIHINIMDPSFSENVKKLDKSKAYALVCQSGNRSGAACGYMAEEGFEELYNLNGGMMGWSA